jgi:hypothetical protein
MSDPERLELQLDRSSPESAEAMDLAFGLLAARVSGGGEYASELARTLQAVTAGSSGIEESARRLAPILDALATAGAFAVTYTAAKLGVDRDDLSAAIGKAITEIHVQGDR